MLLHNILRNFHSLTIFTYPKGKERQRHYARWFSIHTVLKCCRQSVLSPTYRDKMLYFPVQWLNVCFWHKGAIDSPQSCTLLQVRPHPAQLVLSVGKQGVVWGVHSCGRAMNTITIIIVKNWAQFLRYFADEVSFTTIALCKIWLSLYFGVALHRWDFQTAKESCNARKSGLLC